MQLLLGDPDILSLHAPSSASAQSRDIPGVCGQLGANDMGLLPHPLSATAGNAGLRDQLQIQQLLRAAH